MPEVVVKESTESAYGATFGNAESVILTDNPREAVIAKFRELADRLERHELSGARCEWNDSEDQPFMVVVECFKPDGPGVGWVRLIRYSFEPVTKLRAVTSEG